MIGKYSFDQGRVIFAQGYDFYALIQAAMRGADTDNLMRLRAGFPTVYAELEARYNAPGGWLKGDPASPFGDADPAKMSMEELARAMHDHHEKHHVSQET